MAETLSEPVLDVCPDRCGATGADVYRADAHPVRCNWMMSRAERCMEHDELLRPDEPKCPFPEEDEEALDAHHRRS